MSSAYAVVVRVDGTVERFDRPVSLAEVASVLGDVHLAASTIHSPCPPLVPLAMLVNDDGWASLHRSTRQRPRSTTRAHRRCWAT